MIKFAIYFFLTGFPLGMITEALLQVLKIHDRVERLEMIKLLSHTSLYLVAPFALIIFVFGVFSLFTIPYFWKMIIIVLSAVSIILLAKKAYYKYDTFKTVLHRDQKS